VPIAKLKNGLEIYYEVHGQGEPVLLLMGTGADHTFWTPQIGPYAERFQLIVIDSRGTGRSSRPKAWAQTTMRAMAEDAAQLLDFLSIEKAHIGGMSLGSTVSQEFALAWPERVLSLSLHCTWARSDEWFIRAIETIEYPASLGDIHTYLRFALMWVLSPRFLAERPDEVRAIVDRYIDENPHTRHRRRDGLARAAALRRGGGACDSRRAVPPLPRGLLEPLRLRGDGGRVEPRDDGLHRGEGRRRAARLRRRSATATLEIDDRLL
jgi:pimeloyl-ACP methyl ester carboxylesterase